MVLKMQEKDNELGYCPEKTPVPKSKVFFFTSTKKGLGHVSRTMAIHEKLNQANFTSIVGAYEATWDYIKGVNNLTEIQKVRYDFSPTSLPEDPDNETLYLTFVEQNREWLDSLEDSSIVITDFVASSVYIRRYLLERNLVNTQIIGVYHSFTDKNDTQDESIAAWQLSVEKVLDNLDICFLVELKLEHSIPWITSEGTLVIPTDSVVHERKKSKEQVKEEIGLDPSDEYILIQAGMRGNDESAMARYGPISA